MNVKIINTQNEMALVEWLDDDNVFQRSWVVQRMLDQTKDGHIEVEEPEQGIPYGVPFDKCLQLYASPLSVCRELRKRGLWTADDVQARPREVLGALQAAYGIDLANLIRAAKDFENSTED